MSTRQLIIAATQTNDVVWLQEVLQSNTNPHKDIDAVRGLEEACELNHVSCIETLLPYAAEFYNRPAIIPSPSDTQRSMKLVPSDGLADLVVRTVVRNNNVDALSVFKDLLTSEAHIHQCEYILVKCFELGHLEQIDVLLPFVDHIDGLAQHKPQAYAFFEERKAVYQNQRLCLEVGNTPKSSVIRKI